MGSPTLIDRTGKAKLATTDPKKREIHLLDTLRAPLLDKVMLHEVAHAIMISHDMLKRMRQAVPEPFWFPVEEWAAQLVENHSIEAARVASDALGRPVCVFGHCFR